MKHIFKSLSFIFISSLCATSVFAQESLYTLGLSSAGNVQMQRHEIGNLSQSTVVREYPEFNELSNVKPLHLQIPTGEMVVFIATTSFEGEQEIVIVRADNGDIYRRFPVPDGKPLILKNTYALSYFGPAIEVLSDVGRPGFIGNALTWTVYQIASGVETRLRDLDVGNDLTDYALNDEGHFTIYTEDGTFGSPALRFGPFFESNQSVLFVLSPTGKFEGLASSNVLLSRGHSAMVVSEPSAGIDETIVVLNHNLPASISIALTIPLTQSIASVADSTGGLYESGTTYCVHGNSSLAPAQTTVACYNLLTGQHNEAQFAANEVQLIASGLL